MAPRTIRADRRLNDERILQAAARLLAADPSATIASIADEAEVVRLTVYRRYPNREALVVALRRAVAADARASLAAVPGWDEGEDTMYALLRAMLGLGSRYPVAVMRHVVDASPDGSPLDRRIVELLKGGQDAGVLRADVDLELLNGLIHGAVVAALGRSGDAAGAVSEVWLDAMARQVVDVLLVGVGAAEA